MNYKVKLCLKTKKKMRKTKIMFKGKEKKKQVRKQSKNKVSSISELNQYVIIEFQIIITAS